MANIGPSSKLSENCRMNGRRFARNWWSSPWKTKFPTLQTQTNRKKNTIWRLLPLLKPYLLAGDMVTIYPAAKRPEFYHIAQTEPRKMAESQGCWHSGQWQCHLQKHNWWTGLGKKTGFAKVIATIFQAFWSSHHGMILREKKRSNPECSSHETLWLNN